MYEESLFKKIHFILGGGYASSSGRGSSGSGSACSSSPAREEEVDSVQQNAEDDDDEEEEMEENDEDEDLHMELEEDEGTSNAAGTFLVFYCLIFLIFDQRSFVLRFQVKRKMKTWIHNILPPWNDYVKLRDRTTCEVPCLVQFRQLTVSWKS